jgi:hypothetical protein
VVAGTVELAFLPFSFVATSIRPITYAMTVSLSIIPLALVLITALIGKATNSALLFDILKGEALGLVEPFPSFSLGLVQAREVLFANLAPKELVLGQGVPTVASAPSAPQRLRWQGCEDAKENLLGQDRKIAEGRIGSGP